MRLEYLILAPMLALMLAPQSVRGDAEVRVAASLESLLVVSVEDGRACVEVFHADPADVVAGAVVQGELVAVQAGTCVDFAEGRAAYATR